MALLKINECLTVDAEQVEGISTKKVRVIERNNWWNRGRKKIIVEVEVSMKSDTTFYTHVDFGNNEEAAVEWCDTPKDKWVEARRGLHNDTISVPQTAIGEWQKAIQYLEGYFNAK